MSSWTESVKRIANYYDNQKGNITMGIDGVVDEVWQVTESFTSANEPIFYNKVSDFANAILARGSGGMSFPVMPKRRSHGGFTANTGKAVGRLGGTTTLFGVFGKDELDPAFEEMKEFNTMSIDQPPINTIYEFHDGKIFMGARTLRKVRDWEYFVKNIGMDVMRKAYAEANVVGHGYLGTVSVFEEVVTNLINNFLADGPCHRMFFDFANIQNRPKDELMGVLKTLSELNKKVPMTLSMNEHEGKILFGFLGRDFDWIDPLPSTCQDIEYVREQIGLDELLIHTQYFAVGASASEGSALVKQRRAEKIVITTGAGDNFNGAYISSCLQKGVLSLAERLFVGNAVTGSYVRNGNSPDKHALKKEMDELAKFLG